MSQVKLSDKLSDFSGIGYAFSKRLEKLGIITISDLIYHFPFRYDDFSNISNALDAQLGQKVTISGEIWSIKNVFTKSRKVMTQAVFNDGTAPVNLTWFNQSWLTKQIFTGDRLQISGKLTKYKNKLSLVAPVWEKLAKNPDMSANPAPDTGKSLHTGRLVPVYPETFGVTSKWLRTKIGAVLPIILGQIEDPLPDEIRGGMLKLDEAISKIHFPLDWEEVSLAQERLGFDELFYIQLATLRTRQDWKQKPAIKKFQISKFKPQINKLIANLPFNLTTAQQRVIEEIFKDLAEGQPMNRLVQGEVGSGKTIVAAVCAYLAYLNGYKTLYMTPTEILAFQHHSTLVRMLDPIGIKVGIYTGSRKYTRLSVSNNQLSVNRQQKTPTESGKTENRQPDVIVGTHALLSEKLMIENAGLLIVDEQQRFGVAQRTLLRSKAAVPHFLTMTATPIPRTVALTVYGDLDLSVIDEMPIGRKEVITHVVPSNKRDAAYDFIEKKVLEGDQVYIITPLIEESDTLTSVKAAKAEFERLKRKVFPNLNLGLLHGRLSSKEKEKVINEFKDGKSQILVSTSVVEVGMDVTNATIMVIEGAERFGLSQLHQLRGRVGRGEKESYCFLFMGVEDSKNKSRLKNLEKTSSGLKLAELDLKIRGSGEIFGVRQSGRFELKIASFSDLSLIEKTREQARKILDNDPKLEKHPKLRVKLLEVASGVMPD